MKALTLMGAFDRPIAGIIHVGANSGQECAAYRSVPNINCLYIEPIDEVFVKLKENVSRFDGHVALKALCSDVDGESVSFNVANNDGQSSSMFPLGEHSRLFPQVHYVKNEHMTTATLDKIIDSTFSMAHFNLLVIDAQGAELKILRGARRLLSKLDGIFLEVSDIALYEGGCTFRDLVSFLEPFGFFAKWMEIGRYRYGDAFFLREPLDRLCPPSSDESLNLALRKPATQSSLSHWSKDNDAQGGNNGVRTGKFGFHTDIESGPWWQVDLLQNQSVNEIRIYNRIDTCRERSRTLLVFVSDDGTTWKKVHDQAGRPFGGIDGYPLRINLVETTARFIRLELNERQYLHLDEVEIY